MVRVGKAKKSPKGAKKSPKAAKGAPKAAKGAKSPKEAKSPTGKEDKLASKNEKEDINVAIVTEEDPEPDMDELVKVALLNMQPKDVFVAPLMKRGCVQEKQGLDSGLTLDVYSKDSKDNELDESKFIAQAQVKSSGGIANKPCTISGNSHQAMTDHRWYNMQSSELNADTKRDLQVLQLRNYMNPKRFYKASKRGKAFPKVFQVGTVVEASNEFKSCRIAKRQRQRTIMDEIMQDDSIRSYTKRTYNSIQNRRQTKR